MTLYNLRSPSTITKFDADGNPEASYEVSRDSCTCPAGHRPTCRHRQMLSSLLPIIDTIFMWDYDHHMYTDFNGRLVNMDELAEFFAAAEGGSTQPADLEIGSLKPSPPSPPRIRAPFMRSRRGENR